MVNVCNLRFLSIESLLSSLPTRHLNIFCGHLVAKALNPPLLRGVTCFHRRAKALELGTSLEEKLSPRWSNQGGKLLPL